MSTLSVRVEKWLNPSSHIHVSLRDADGKSLFAVSDSELQSGRAGAAYNDTKYISQIAEWFLAGILDGLPDSKPSFRHNRMGSPLILE